MALDGIVLSNIVSELCETLVGGRIDKIYQPEKDELLLSIRSQKNAYKLFLTANSNYPRIHLTNKVKNTSQNPPMFCMLLRKHLSSGKITSVSQPYLDRIVQFEIEALNELGDKEQKKLIIEIMGRHSNIILTKEDGTIIDSIKHISSAQSSLREVLPGRSYFFPNNQHKLNPTELTYETFKQAMLQEEMQLYKALYTHLTGVSPLYAKALCTASHLEFKTLTTTMDDQEFKPLYQHLEAQMERLKKGDYSPTLWVDANEAPIDFYSFPLASMASYTSKYYASISELLETYYFEESVRSIVSQKTSDIKKLIINFIDRSIRKKSIQEKAIEESEDSEIYKVYGELLTAYSFQVVSGNTSFKVGNFYSETYEEIEIPLDPQLSAIENAQKYFKIYNKAKRTLVAAEAQLKAIEEDLAYLNSVLISLDFLQTAEDIEQLRHELVDMGYLKKRKASKIKTPKNSIPYMQFTTTDGYSVYVGKNNYQNDELTMKFAKATDLWLHIKDGPGSHVIVKLPPGEEPSDVALIEAALLAAYFSKGKHSSNVPIDYTLRKYVKKVPNAKPGMVIYNQFHTLYVTPDVNLVRKLEKQ